jgi:hypothetical protein
MRKLALVAASLPALAFAGDLDLDLSRYAQVFRQDDPNPRAGGSPIDCGRAAGDFCYVIPDHQKFYSLASELGVVLAPKFLMPAETLGYNGFSFGFQTGFTDISQDQPFWDAVQMYDPSDPEPDRPPTFVHTMGVMAHKGVWLPLPSFEVGAGFNYLPRSGMWTMIVDVKFALHEGFMLPALAVRGSGGRMVGNNQMDLTLGAVDFSLSKSFGVAGTLNLTPYAGYQILWIVADPEVLDATPGEDAIDASRGADGSVPQCSDSVADCNAYFVFLDPDPILRHRVFVGIRLVIGVFNITGEFAMAMKGSSTFTAENVGVEIEDDGTASSTAVTVEDQADVQPAAHVKVGLDF